MDARREPRLLFRILGRPLRAMAARKLGTNCRRASSRWKRPRRLRWHSEAARFIEGFNGTMLTRRCRLWAVAVPVTIRYEGDLRTGQTVRRSSTELLGLRRAAG